MYEQALADVAAAPTAMRVDTASAWAEILAAIDSPDPLSVLLGHGRITCGDVESRCRTKRARNLLRANGIGRLDRLIALTVTEVRSLRRCGRESVIDILAAMLLTLVDDQSVPAGANVPLPGMGIELEVPEPWEPRSDGMAKVAVSDPLLDLLEGR
ncbi:hypothetical protein V7968_02395 [Nocardia vulneris]|uniref:hypothetical protein n=1 Tax=Nocardia vulneris TaxID=1141657 RepID=UPI0030D163F3